jgi:microcin C transport system permease protein
MIRFRIDPVTKKRFARFRRIRRGYWSLLIFVAMLLVAAFAELLINNRALVVLYQGKWYFPTYGSYIPGTEFGFDYQYETNYRDLKAKLSESATGDFVIMPLVPYGPLENNLREAVYPPYPPSMVDQHFLGTDTTGRDILARLVYGFRIAILFSLVLLVCNFAAGIIIGICMGYFGGLFDLLFQRLIEIWSNVPFLYVVIIISSIMVPNFTSLVGIMVFFGWMPMTWYLRAIAYKEKARDYVAAARTLGASHSRIIFNHILPNAVSMIITFAPFSLVSGITALTALDFLGFGLPAPTPSWGEMLNQGKENLNSVWIVGSVTIAMITVLMVVTFIGEAVREAFDPKQRTVFE